mgnify:CR=1 FL=1|jgi:hypothetical protein
MELINRGKFLMERGTSQGYFQTKKRMKKIASRTRTRGVGWLTLIGSNTQIINYIQKNLYIRNTLIYTLDFVTH